MSLHTGHGVAYSSGVTTEPSVMREAMRHFVQALHRGLRVAVGLLAERIAPDDPDLAAVCRTPTSSTDEIRRALLLSLRRREPGTAHA